MRIKLEVSGGFAGFVRSRKEVNCDSLDEHVASKWRQLIEQVHFFELPHENLTKNGCDLMQYAITIQDGSKLHQVTLDELTLTKELWQIVMNLQAEK